MGFNVSKKGQIPPTLTWIVAFLIIFFIMLLFISSTAILAAQRTIKIDTSKYDSYKSRSTRTLISILDTPTSDEKTTVKELIRQWEASQGEERENLKQEAINTITRWKISEEKECYIFSARNEVSQGSQKTSSEPIGYETVQAAPDARNSIEIHNIVPGKVNKITNGNINYIRNSLLQKAVDIYLISGDERIKISFYVGAC